MDENFLPLAIFLLLLTGTHEKDILDELSENKILHGSGNNRKRIKSQTYVRATTLQEFIEVERTDEGGKRSYKVEAKLEPFEFVLPVKDIVKNKEKEMKIALELKKLKIEGINKFKIIGSSSGNKNKDKAKIKFDLPDTVKIVSDYSLSGIILNKKIKGTGTVNISVIGVSVNGLVRINDDSKQELQIDDLNLSYDFKDLQVEYTGLEIEGLSSKQTDEIVMDVLNIYLKENSEVIGNKLGNNIRKKLNMKLKGVSSIKIISMLKNV